MSNGSKYMESKQKIEKIKTKWKKVNHHIKTSTVFTNLDCF